MSIPSQLRDILSQFNTAWKTELELNNEVHLARLYTQADQLFREVSDTTQLKDLDKYLADEEKYETGTRVALKLALSKSIIAVLNDRVTVSVVFAVYNEHNRMMKASEHVNGEDFLNKKIEQLNWLNDSNPNFQWNMLVVDDGCPNNSGKKAQEILGNDHPNVSVKYLADGIHQQHESVIPLENADDSRKGGSILYGMALAAEQKEPNHIIIYTDADLSTHLGQTGLLIEPILKGEQVASIGSRREANSVVVKKGLRNTRGKLFIYLWKRLLPQIHDIIDTQCGYKAFSAPLARKVIFGNVERKFSFDLELLLKTELAVPHSISKTAIAWIDSDAESTTVGDTYLEMLHSVVKIYRQYTEGNAEAETWAQCIESMDSTSWNVLVNEIPKEIADADPTDLKQLLISPEKLFKL